MESYIIYLYQDGLGYPPTVYKNHDGTEVILHDKEQARELVYKFIRNDNGIVWADYKEITPFKPNTDFWYDMNLK